MLEGIAHQAQEVVGAMEGDTGAALSGVRVDGGVSLSNELLQYQADLCNLTVERPKDVETTAAGAAIAAGLGAGVYDDVGAVPSSSEDIERAFTPVIGSEERQERCARWSKAVEASLGWA